MKYKLDYLKSFIKVLFWPILLELGQFLLIILFTIFFNMNYIATLKKQFPNLTDFQISNKFNEIMNTNKYIEELNIFLRSRSLIIIIILMIIVLPLIIKSYKKLKIKENKTYKLTKLIINSCLLALILNITIYLINTILPITNRYDNMSIKINIILTTGFLAPILEEYIFRGLVYNKLKKFNSKKTAIIITTILFALLHFELSQIIYTLLVGFYLIYIYDKTNNIYLSILTHIIINTSTILLMPLIINTNIYIQVGLLIILSLCFYQNLIINFFKENT